MQGDLAPILMQHFQHRESKFKKGDLKFITKYFIIELNSDKSNHQFSLKQL